MHNLRQQQKITTTSRAMSKTGKCMSHNLDFCIKGNACQSKENFILFNSIKVIMHDLLRCGDYVESQCYNSASGVKGGRIVTKDICASCYEIDNIVLANEIRQKRNVGVKNPLLVCRHCFDKNIETPCSGGRVNAKQKKDQLQRAKKRKETEQVEKGRRKEKKSK